MSYPFQCQLKQLLKWSLGLLNTDSPPFPLSITLSNFRHFKKSGGTSAICLIRGKSDQSTRYIKVSKEALKNSINNNNFLKLGLKAQLIRTSLQWSKVSSRFLSPAPFLCALSHSHSLCSSHEAPLPVPKHQQHFAPGALHCFFSLLNCSPTSSSYLHGSLPHLQVFAQSLYS